MGAPVNIDILQPDQFIQENGIQEVTSNLITEPSTDQFHPDGLYSEEIFGAVTSNERLRTFGFINLNTHVIHPKLYIVLTRLKKFFAELMSGETYAVWDDENKQFIKATEEDEDADTGYAFFMTHVHELNFTKTGSIPSDTKIDVYEKFKDQLLMSKHLVIPAGLRDYNLEASGRGSSEEINKHYNALLNYSRAVASAQGNDPMYDTVRMAMQRKVHEIYKYIENMMAGPEGGKKGYLQSKYGKRNIALGARNVISAAQFSGSDPNDSRFHDVDETKLPLVVVNSSFQPLVVYYLRRFFFNSVITPQHEQASVVNPDTYQLEYQAIDDTQKNLYTTSDGADKLINLFQNIRFRDKPASILNKNQRMYYLGLIYDDGDDIIFTRSINNIKHKYQEVYGKEPDTSKLRPITYVEMFYIAAAFAVKGRFVSIKRDPAVDLGNVYVSRAYVMTTQKSRKVDWVILQDDGTEERHEFPEYPIPGEDYVESTVLHPSRLEGLGGDYDGDAIMDNSIMNKASVEECEEYINSKQHVLNPAGHLAMSIDTDVTKLVFYNLSLMEKQAE